MQMDISARTVSAVLHALQEISGAHYDRLLEHAGWARFRAGIPAESDALIATRAELESLFAQVYLILGEGLTRLFLRNYGRSAARQALNMATGPRWRAAAAATLPDQRLTWFVGAMLQMTTRSWTPTTLTADARAYYFTFERCPLCAGIHDAQAPLCTSAEAMYGYLAQQLIQRRVRLVEVECAATGAPHCKVALYKVGAGEE